MKLQKRTKENDSILMLWIVLSVIWILSIITILFFNSGKETGYLIHVKNIILSVILIGILFFFILENQIKTGDFPYFNLILIGSYLLSLPLMLIAKGNTAYHIWLIGSLIISTIINVNLGFIVLFHHVFLASLLGNYKAEQVIYLLIFGVALCILSKHMKVRNLLKYIIAITVSLNLILEFVMNDFLINKILRKEILITILLDIILVLTTYMISNVYDNKIKYHGNKKTYQKPYSKVSLEDIINPNFILLQELNRYSNKLYERSLKVAKISSLAAKEIGANEKLAQAGGLYHDIGRMRDGDYVIEGLKLIKHYNMPSEIEDMINQHNIKYNIPKSPESAIIMLTVSIIATKDILEKSDTKHSMTMKKIVENVFDMRLSKHSLDESGLTIHQFNQLKAFYTSVLAEWRLE